MVSLLAAIAIGSNVGARDAHVAFAFEAIARLPGTQIVARGPVIRTVAVGKPGVDAGGEYLNSCVVVRTSYQSHKEHTPGMSESSSESRGCSPESQMRLVSFGARELLAGLHEIERERGRDRAAEGRWGPRTLDLDLLVYGDAVIDEPGLTVPHPRLHERRFVLEPLAAIAPEMMVPGRGRVVELLRVLMHETPVKKG